MTTIPTNVDTTKILLDMKPALDGYAGIPQESRLLFRGLRTMEGCEVEGLIQHGSRKLRAAVSPKGRALSPPKQINKLSRVIVSLYEKPYNTVFDTVIDEIDRYFSRSLLRARSFAGMSIRPSVFESQLFDDFIWRTFFSKTLKPGDKNIVTSARFRVLKTPRKLLTQAGLAGMKFSSNPRFVSLDTRGFDFFLAQTPFPARISRKTQMIVRYHDAVPMLLPHTIKDKAFHQASHFYSLQQNVKSGAWFSCVSEATRNDLLKIFPEAEARSSVIHNIVSSEYFEDDSPKRLVFQIVRNRLGRVEEFQTDLGGIQFDGKKDRSQDFDYLLMVSTLEPRKNHMLLLNAWERLKYTSMPNLKLVIVGSLGWDSGPILDALAPWAERGDLFYLNNVPSAELRVLYKHAAATICPSVAEGFNYAGVEAMRCGGIVISSDIPVHREIYRRASEYFNAYSTEDAAMVIRRVLSEDGRSIRDRLRAEARLVADNYTPHNILPQWGELFQTLKKS
jgi:glycosyltransferase involved in cell wall biosynthesis